jgi:hypothetical protein
MAISKPLFAIVREFQQFDVGVVERSQQLALSLELKVENIVLGNLSTVENTHNHADHVFNITHGSLASSTRSAAHRPLAWQRNK